ncbi:hypothetical protein TEQG_00776 [Trichophyton equinum CBS 127.97]|uniref:Uncharacterized protein n=1 Tax=Trichophyton equinum (strain ATCC MYA-4606 / CBS 127.97) TaxID=559882 RepID=F2PIH0_TRIEC|nr:hypothetical protein TEQG_00776 [Trichophyton equinum CBS 127.97]
MFNATRVLGVAYRGISLEALGMEAGVGYSSTVDIAGNNIEKKFPVVVEGRVQGTKPHQSSKDKSDKKDVVTVGYYTAKGTRILTIHAHEDGTWVEFLSRAGKALLASLQGKEGSSKSK